MGRRILLIIVAIAVSGCGARPERKGLEAASPEAQAAAFQDALARADELRGQSRLDAARSLLARALARSATVNQQIAALGALGRLGSPACLDVIRPYMANQRPEVQRAAYEALCDVTGEAATEAIAAALPVAPGPLRPMLIRALGARRFAAALDPLMEAAVDRDQAVAVAALEALAEIADPAALHVVRFQAEHGPTEAVRQAALRAYLALGPPLVAEGKVDESLRLFEHALALATRDRERIEALTGLAVVGGRKALPRLLPLLKTAKGGLLAAAADLCLALGDRLAPTDRETALAVWRQVAGSDAPADLVRQARDRLAGERNERKRDGSIIIE